MEFEKKLLEKREKDAAIKVKRAEHKASLMLHDLSLKGETGTPKP